MKKQIFALFWLLGACLPAIAEDLGSIIPGTAMLSGKEIPMWYTVVGDGLAVVGNGRIASISQYSEGALTVPSDFRSTADGRQYQVVGIGNFAFSLCSRLTSITLSEGIQTIGEQAFSGCHGLTAVQLPLSLTTISRGAFSECRQLSTLALPDGLTTMGQEAFAGVHFANRELVVPPLITAIPLAAFEQCPLRTVVLPPGLQSVGPEAFAGIVGCDVYMFDGTAAPTVAEDAFSEAARWFVTAPEHYTGATFCNGRVTIQPMTHDGEFTVGSHTFEVLGYGIYPGRFQAAAIRRNGNAPWPHAYNALPASVVHSGFTGHWHPYYDVTGINPQFFSGEGIERLQQVALPPSIIPSEATGAFARCAGLLALDLSALAPLTPDARENLLDGLPENTVVYAPEGQTEEILDHNMVLADADGNRRTSHFRLHIDDSFNDLAMRGAITYALPHPFEAARATFYRASFDRRGNETIVLPFASEPGGKAYAFHEIAQGADGTAAAVFREAVQMEAGKPYLYAADGNAIEATDVLVSTEMPPMILTDEANLCGVYGSGVLLQMPEITDFDGNLYVYSGGTDTSDNSFLRAGSNTRITPFHAFFYVKDKSMAAKLSLSIDGSMPTGISELPAGDTAAPAPFYNLQGVRLPAHAAKAKGLYISRGKKIIIR